MQREKVCYKCGHGIYLEDRTDLKVLCVSCHLNALSFKCYELLILRRNFENGTD